MGNLITPKRVQKLQMALHAKAKAEAGYRFYALYDKLDFSAFEGSRSAFISERLAYFRLKRTKSIAPVATAAR